jgi:AraC-like DNA-binding protein
MPEKTVMGKGFGKNMADFANFLAIRDSCRNIQVRSIRETSMNALFEMISSQGLSREGLLERTKITGDGHIELIPRKSCAGGMYLLKPAGKSLVVSVANITFRQPVTYTARDELDYFCVSLCRGSMRGITGVHMEKDKVYRQHIPAGFSNCGVGVSFLPEFFDLFLNSRHGVSPDEIAQAVKALGKAPLIPDAAVILTHIGEASVTGDAGNIWLEAKALELISVVLDWRRRLGAASGPPLREHDRLGIAEALRYAEEHISGPLSLGALARQAAMSISKFTAAFKKHTGLSAAAYVRRFRMDKAMYLIKNTTAPLRDIAGMTGYKHYARFSSLFREQFGLTPREVRNGDDT